MRAAPIVSITRAGLAAAAVTALVSCTGGSTGSIVIPDPTAPPAATAAAPLDTSLASDPSVADTTATSSTTAVPATPNTTTIDDTTAVVTTAPPTDPAPPTTRAPSPDQFLRIGDEGEAVATMQRKLVALDYLSPGYTEGVFDRATADALIDFQGQYGVVVDSIFGPETNRALTAAANSVDVDP